MKLSPPTMIPPEVEFSPSTRRPLYYLFPITCLSERAAILSRSPALFAFRPNVISSTFHQRSQHSPLRLLPESVINSHVSIQTIAWPWPLSNVCREYVLTDEQNDSIYEDGLVAMLAKQNELPDATQRGIDESKTASQDILNKIINENPVYRNGKKDVRISWPSRVSKQLTWYESSFSHHRGYV